LLDYANGLPGRAIANEERIETRGRTLDRGYLKHVPILDRSGDAGAKNHRSVVFLLAAGRKRLGDDAGGFHK
jgi:hypothetical protein